LYHTENAWDSLGDTFEVGSASNVAESQGGLQIVTMPEKGTDYGTRFIAVNEGLRGLSKKDAIQLLAHFAGELDCVVIRRYHPVLVAARRKAKRRAGE
jgi:hypothetical protein